MGALGAWVLFPEVTWSGHLCFASSTRRRFSRGRIACFRTRRRIGRRSRASCAAHPWHAIFGIGYKTLPYSTFIGQTVIADNMYLSLLAETGIIGLAAFFLLNFAILRAAWRAARRSDSQKSFFGAWIFCFWIGQLFQMLSGDLFTYWRVLPLYFGSRNRRDDERPGVIS